MPDKPNSPPARPKIFSDEFVAKIGEKLANEVTDLICRNLTGTETPVRPTTLCLELIVFELDEKVLREITNCAFHQLNILHIVTEILTVLHIINGNTDAEKKRPLPITKYTLISAVVKKVNCLETVLTDSCDLRTTIFEEILLIPKHLPHEKLTDPYAVIDHVIIQQFRQALTEQYDHFALKLCNKVSCIQSDLEFIASQIKEATINYPAVERGIIEMADAASDVARSFYSEEHNFDEVFDAAEETAKLIEDLASYYQYKLSQLEHYLSLSYAGCPTPINAPTNLPSIPELPPPPPVFPIVGLTGAQA